MLGIRNSDPRSLGSLSIKGTGESILNKDSPVTWMDSDPSDLGSLILFQFIPKKRTLNVYVITYPTVTLRIFYAKCNNLTRKCFDWYNCIFSRLLIISFSFFFYVRVLIWIFYINQKGLYAVTNKYNNKQSSQKPVICFDHKVHFCQQLLTSWHASRARERIASQRRQK